MGMWEQHKRGVGAWKCGRVRKLEVGKNREQGGRRIGLIRTASRACLPGRRHAKIAVTCIRDFESRIRGLCTQGTRGRFAEGCGSASRACLPGRRNAKHL